MPSLSFSNQHQGKTILTSIIIEEIQRLHFFQLAFFFSRPGDPSRNNFRAILRGLLIQLVHHHLNLIPEVYEKCTSSGEIILESIPALTALFETVFRSCTRPFIIIDGIDECEPIERKQILTYLSGIMSTIEKEGQQYAKILYTSRDEADIRKLLSMVSRREILLQDVEPDIKEYVLSMSFELQEMFELSDSWRHKIASIVSDRARGNIVYHISDAKLNP
jgi:hypothetical protein